MRALLDVSMLIALLDPLHLNATVAHEWFADNEELGWATCPITQNGYVRIVSQAAYGSGLTTAEAASLLRDLVARPSHAFWADTITVLDEDVFHLDRLPSGKHVTETYLIGLARANDGVFVTLDSRLFAQSVADGEMALVLV